MSAGRPVPGSVVHDIDGAGLHEIGFAGQVTLSGGGSDFGIFGTTRLRAYLSEQNRLAVEVNTERLQARIQPSTGEISGTYLESNTRNKVRFRSAVLQTQQVGSGVCAGNGKTGFIHLRKLVMNDGSGF